MATPHITTQFSLTQFKEKAFFWYTILIISFIFCYARVIATLVRVWWNIEIYSYGLLVPFISLYIVWLLRNKIKNIQHSTNYIAGLFLLTVGMLTLRLGLSMEVVSLQGLSLVTTVIGIIVLLFGKNILLALWFPLSYLLFMVPFWDRLIERLHVPLQNFSALMGEKLLQVVGISVLRDSTFITLPNITLEVAKECSGVNNLIAVVAVAVPLAYFTLNSWTRRFILIVSGLTIAILFNGLRVALIGVLSYYGLSQVLHGPYHVLQAMSVSVVGFIVLFIMAWVISKGELKNNGILKPFVAKNLLSDKDVPVLHSAVITSIILITVAIYINFF